MALLLCRFRSHARQSHSVPSCVVQVHVFISTSRCRYLSLTVCTLWLFAFSQAIPQGEFAVEFLSVRAAEGMDLESSNDDLINDPDDDTPGAGFTAYVDIETPFVARMRVLNRSTQNTRILLRKNDAQFPDVRAFESGSVVRVLDSVVWDFFYVREKAVLEYWDSLPNECDVHRKLEWWVVTRVWNAICCCLLPHRGCILWMASSLFSMTLVSWCECQLWPPSSLVSHSPTSLPRQHLPTSSGNEYPQEQWLRPVHSEVCEPTAMLYSILHFFSFQ